MKRPLRTDDDELGHLVTGRLRRPVAAGEVCPDAEVLAAYVDGGLSAAEIDRVDTHLVECARCRATLETLSPAAVDLPQAGIFGRLPRIDRKWLSLAAMVIVGVSLWMAWPTSPISLPAPAVAREATPPTPVQPATSPRPATAGGAVPSASEQKLADATSRAQAPALDEQPGGRAAASAPAPPPAPQRAVSTVVGGVAQPSPADNLQRAAAPASVPTLAAPAAPAEPAAPPLPAPVLTERRAANADAARARREADLAAEALASRAAGLPAGAAADAAKQSPAKIAAEGAGARAAQGAVTAKFEPAAAVEFREPEGRLRWRIVGGRRIDSSSDAGVSWNPSYSDPRVRLLAGSAPDISSAWAVGADGTVIRRAVPGPWARVTSPANEDLVAISASSATAARVTTRSGQVYETSDGGATWNLR